jgi:hypothetical protein
MMSSLLPKLLGSGLVSAGDYVAFRFKKNQFQAEIDGAGLLKACTMNGTPLPGVHDNLQSWCEECIVEHSKDYVQRFASMRRVKHSPTGRTFAQLKDMMQASPDMPCQCAEAVAQRRRVLQLEQQVAALQAQVEKPAKKIKIELDNPFLLMF